MRITTFSIIAVIALFVCSKSDALVTVNPRALKWAVWEKNVSEKITIFRDVYRMVGMLGDSSEIYAAFLDSPSRESLSKLVAEVLSKMSNIKREDIVKNMEEYKVRWFWLVATENGLVMAQPGEMSKEIRERMKKTKSYAHVIRMEIPVDPDDSAFFSKAMSNLQESHPLAMYDDVERKVFLFITPTLAGTRAFLDRTQNLLVAIKSAPKQ